MHISNKKKKMKTRFVIVIIIGVIIFGTTTYLYDQMYDCLNPPMWMKIPFFGLDRCLQMYANGTLPDWTQAREDYAKKHALSTKLIEQFKDKPEVVAFYSKYEDTNVSVRDDHVSYFAGNEDDFFVRMNFYFDQNYQLDYIDFHCYVNRVHQTDVPQSFILKYLKDWTCNEYGSQRTGNIQIRGNMANQICSIISDECPSYYIGNMQDDGSVMVGMIISDQEQTIQYQFFINNDTLTYETINEN